MPSSNKQQENSGNPHDKKDDYKPAEINGEIAFSPLGRQQFLSYNIERDVEGIAGGNKDKKGYEYNPLKECACCIIFVG
jgi:hypothetical protein